MSINFFKIVILSIFFTLPYMPLPVWKFLVCAPLNIFMLFLFFKNYRDFKFSFKDLAKFFSGFFVFFFSCLLLINYSIDYKHFLPHKGFTLFFVIITPFFQSLQEEIYLRSIQRSLWANKSLFILKPFLLAAVMAFLHYAIYAFGYEANPLNPLALTTLFMFFFGTAYLYEKTQNWILPYGIHAGWNMCRFGFFVIGDKDNYLESASFNSLEGHPLTAAFATSMVLVVFLAVCFYSKRGCIKNSVIHFKKSL